MARHTENRIGLAAGKTSIILSQTGMKAYPRRYRSTRRATHSLSFIRARLVQRSHTAIVWKMYGETTGEPIGNGMLEVRSVVNGYHQLPSSYFRPVEIGCVVGLVKLLTHQNLYMIIRGI